jgi:hypothetical protein
MSVDGKIQPIMSCSGCSGDNKRWLADPELFRWLRSLSQDSQMIKQLGDD